MDRPRRCRCATIWLVWRRRSIGRVGIATAHPSPRASRRCSNYPACSIAKRRPVPSWSSAPSSVADDALRDIDFESNLDDRRHKINFGSIIAILVLSILLILTNLAHGRSVGAAMVWRIKRALAAEDLSFGVRDLKTARSSSRAASLTHFASPPSASVVPEVMSLRIREGKGPRTNAAMSKFAANDFRYDLPAVHAAGDDRSRRRRR